VLHHQQHGRGSRRQIGPELLDVVVGGQPGGLELDRSEAVLLAHVLDVDGGDLAARRTRDDHEVEQADRPRLDQLLHRLDDRARQGVGLEGDEQELDGSVAEFVWHECFSLSLAPPHRRLF